MNHHLPIVIDNPCQESWDAMKPLQGARFCDVCKTPVVDFTKKSPEEIREFFEQHDSANICGRYRIQHTSQAKPVMKFLNRLEAWTHRSPYKKAVQWIIACVLVLSGCVRHVQGKLRAYDTPSFKKDKKSHTQNLTGQSKSDHK